jgi:hypothetical protein
MASKALFLILICLLVFVKAGAAGDGVKEKAAVSAAERWLSLVDSGYYADSWAESAEYLRNAVNRREWLHSMETIRKPLGNVISRKVMSATYHTSLPGAPDGEYVVIRFKSSFENKRSSIETVTPLLENDHIWRVSGYYIK